MVMTPDAGVETCWVPLAGTEVDAVREALITWYGKIPAGALICACMVEGAVTVAVRGETVTVAPAKRVDIKSPAAAQMTITTTSTQKKRLPKNPRLERPRGR